MNSVGWRTPRGSPKFNYPDISSLIIRDTKHLCGIFSRNRTNYELSVLPSGCLGDDVVDIRIIYLIRFVGTYKTDHWQRTYTKQVVNTAFGPFPPHTKRQTNYPFPTSTEDLAKGSRHFLGSQDPHPRRFLLRTPKIAFWIVGSTMPHSDADDSVRNAFSRLWISRCS